MRVVVRTVIPALLLLAPAASYAQETARALVAVWAHPDDEGVAAPVLARYAREGVRVHVIIATDGSQGAANTKLARGPEIARARAEEARCATQALGIQPPILLGFPDGALGNNVTDPAILYKLTQRLHDELQRLRPAAVITWGPEGGYGHPDHRLVSSIVTQLARAGAPAMPQRVFYAWMPTEAIGAMNPERGVPPLLVPNASLFNVRVRFTDGDFEAARASMACHKTQFPDDVVDRMTKVMKDVWKGELLLSPIVPRPPSQDLFK